MSTNPSPYPTPDEDRAADQPATPAATPSAPVALTEDQQAIKDGVIAMMKTVFDPEIPVNIYELGMCYGVEVGADASVLVKMTLTSPACPVAGSLPGEVQAKIATVPGVSAAKVDLVWEPAWNPSMMSEAAKLTLGF